MQELPNLLIELLVYIVLGGIIATLEMCFQHYMWEGMIFHDYFKWLMRIIKMSTEKRLKWWIHKFSNGDVHTGTSKITQWWYIRLIAKISNPLGLCCYCNGTWVAILTYLLLFGFNLRIFLLIGTTWFFIKILDNKFNQ